MARKRKYGKRNYGKFTARRKAALKKAQLESARKRRRRGGRRKTSSSQYKGFGAGITAAAALGAAYVIGKRTNSLRGTPGGTLRPSNTDPNVNAKQVTDELYQKQKDITYIDPQGPTTRLQQKGKTPDQQTGGLQTKARSGKDKAATAAAAASSASAAAQILEGNKPEQLTLDVPLAPLGSKPKNGVNPKYKPRSLVDVIQSPAERDQILGWKVYSPQMQEHTRRIVKEHGFLISDSLDPMRGGVLYKPLTAAQKAANTRKRNKQRKQKNG